MKIIAALFLMLALARCADYTYNRGCEPPFGGLYKCK